MMNFQRLLPLRQQQLLPVGIDRIDSLFILLYFSNCHNYNILDQYIIDV